MLKQPQPGAMRRRAGLVSLGLVLAACSYAAWAVRPAAAPEPPRPPAVPEAPAAPRAPDAPPAPPMPAAPAAPPVPAMPPPAYPADAAAAGQGGRVVLKLLVGVDGRVKDVVVERSEPAGVFDAETVEAARQWTLKPAMKDGVPVEGWVRVPVDFEAPAPAPAPSPEAH